MCQIAVLSCLLVGLVAGVPAARTVAGQSTPSPSSQPSSRPAKIDAADVAGIRAHIGKTAVVTGKISSAKLSSTGKVFRIEFKDAKESGFNSVIFERNLKSFRDALGSDLSAGLTDKTVELTGTIDEYRGNPQIILTRPDQLRILP